jgi:GntR family transcriptional regulator, arabinose operon transcriptional repressor
MTDFAPFKYQQVTSKALAYIEAHGMRPGDRLPSEREFAEAIGVSRPTVNKALACLIAEGRLRREGYKLFVAVPAPEAGAVHSIAVLCPHPLRQRKIVSHNLIEAAHDTCEVAKMGFTPLLSSDGMQQREQLQELLKSEGRHHGVVIWPHTDSHCGDLLRQLSARGMPVVVNDLDFGPFDFVGIDNQQGMGLLVKHLFDLGHREIAYFTRKLAIDSLVQRREGFDFAAFRLLNQRPGQHLYEMSSGDDNGELPELLARFLAESRRATAICCSHDFVALELSRLCQAQGMQVPEDISISGFDGIDASAASSPPLTTAAQDFYHMGVLSVEQVIRRIRMPQSEHMPGEQKIRVSPRLIVRGSTCPPPKSVIRRGRRRFSE